jgi:DNA-binding MarR family transcriptional regulator
MSSFSESLVALACQVNEAIASALDPILKENELTPAMFDLLSAVRTADGRETQAQIGQRMGLSRATISESITALEHDGYVLRKAHPEDKRAVFLTLTARGHQKLNAVLREMKEIENLAVAKLSEKESATAIKTLKKLLIGIQSATK